MLIPYQVSLRQLLLLVYQRKAAFVLYAPFRQVTINGRTVKPKTGTWILAGQRQCVWRCVG